MCGDLLVGFMAEQKFLSPLKAGLLLVAIAYFLFTLHQLFTLQWIGEWEPLREPIRTTIFVEDITATALLAFRFFAGILAVIVAAKYLVKKELAKPTAYRYLRWILVFEAMYWFGLLTTAGYSVQGFISLITHQRSIESILYSLSVSVIPTIFEAVVLPVILLILAYKVKPSKPLKNIIKWGLITGTVYIVSFWLTNMSIWVSVVRQKGLGYLWSATVPINGASQVVLHPEHLISFVTTVFGLLAIAIYTGYFTKKSAGTEELRNLRTGSLGSIVLALGLYYLWNYFSWVVFAGATWNDWYRWLLGHNLDLWMLALPLVALPLLFYRKDTEAVEHS